MKIQHPNQVHKAFVDLFNRGDTAGLAGLYEAQAVIVPEPGKTVTGAAAIKEVLAGFVGMGGTMSITTTACVVTGDSALLRGKWSLRGKGADGKPFELAAESVETMRRQSDGTWKYVIDLPWGAA